ncbi:hypothetical protein SFUMM280S_05058 [Streptomyces fumanus]
MPGAEQQAAAVGRVDVQPGAVGGAAGGDLGQRVDEAGVGGAGGGGDEVGAGGVAQGVVEGVGVEAAGRGGDGDGVGQAVEPGGAGQRVVGVGAVHEAQAGSVVLAGEEDGELVGFGAAGGDEGVGGAGLVGEGAGDEGFQGGGGGGLVPGVEGGVEGAGGEVGGGGDGERRSVQVAGAQGVGGVGGAGGEGGDEGAQGVGVAVVGEDVAEGVAELCGDGVRAAGRWCAARRSAQACTSRSVAAARESRKSARAALPNRCREKWMLMPARKSFSPSQATSWRRAEAPLA